MGTRIDDSVNKVTLVGSDKIPLGDGSFSPKHYTADQIAEYAVSTVSAAITSVNQVVSVLSDARTSIGQAVSVNTAAIVSINNQVSVLDAARTSTGQAVSVLSAARASVGQDVSVLLAARTSIGQAVSVNTAAIVSINAVLSSSVLTTSQGDARYMSTAETCALVEAYNYMVSVSNISAGTYGTSTIIPQIVVGTNGVITDIILVTAPPGGSGLTTAEADALYMSTAETCALVEAYGYASINAVSTMISAKNLVSILTIGNMRDLSAGDQNGYLAWTSTGGGIFSIPTCASVAFPIGTQITFRQRNGGKLGVSAAPGVSIQAPSSCSTEARGQGSTFTLIKYTSDTWDITGDLSVK